MTTALEGGEWSAAGSGRNLPPRKTRYPLYRRLGWPQGRSGWAENLAPPGFDPRTAQPVVSPYTYWATGLTCPKACGENISIETPKLVQSTEKKRLWSTTLYPTELCVSIPHVFHVFTDTFHVWECRFLYRKAKKMTQIIVTLSLFFCQVF